MNKYLVATFQAAVEAIAREDWRAAAELCDPASLAAFKRQTLSRLAPTTPTPKLTAERLMRVQPDLPHEVAEYQVRQHERYADPAWLLADLLPGVESIPQVEAMLPTDLFAVHLSASSREHQIERARRYGALPASMIEAVRAVAWRGPEYWVIGTLEDGPRMGYVIYRRDYSPQPGDSSDPETEAYLSKLTPEERELTSDLSRGRPEFATCRRQQDGTWRLLAEQGFLGQGNEGLWYGSDDEDEPQDG